MTVTAPTETNFLYRLEFGEADVVRFTNIAENQIYDGEEYAFIPIDHTAPTFSGEAQDAEIDVLIHERNTAADQFTLGPPPYPVIVRILEYDRLTDTAEDYYKGWVIRPSFDLSGSVVGFHCKSLFHFFERESFTDSLSALSRYSIFDPRSGVDIEAFRVTVTVDTFNDARDVITVTGITEADGWFRGGLIVAPDRDMRTILEHETITGGAKQLTLNGAFPEFTLATGFTADIYPGDDLQHGTWVVKFGAETGAGRAFGGWPYTPNVDPAVKGVI